MERNVSRQLFLLKFLLNAGMKLCMKLCMLTFKFRHVKFLHNVAKINWYHVHVFGGSFGRTNDLVQEVISDNEISK